MEIADGAFVTFNVSQSFDPDEKSDLEYRFNFGNNVYSDWVTEGQTTRLYENAFFTGSNGGTLQLSSGEEVIVNEGGIIRVFRLINSELYEIDSSNGLSTGKGYNYILPENTEEKTYFAQLMTREISDNDADILASAWSEPIEIDVYMPENIRPIANAQAGIFVEIDGEIVGIWSDRVDYAKTGDEISYSADESYDPDGEIVSYHWRILNPKGTEINILGDKDKKTFKRTYNEPGTYTAVLTVTDDRGGENTWQAVVIVTTTGPGLGEEEEEDDGLGTNVLIGGAALGAVGLFGGARALSRLGGGGEEEFDEGFEDVAALGDLELQCPSCGGLISITTTQRPIQIGCPMCQSQFVLNE